MANEPNMSPVAPADLAPVSPTVNAYDRTGAPINLPAADVPALLKMGGRLPSEQELAQERADSRAGTSSFLEDTLTAGPAYAAGKRTTGKLVQAAFGDSAIAPVEAYAHGVNSGMTLGFGQVAAKEALRSVAGDEAARAYADQAGDLAKAYPGSTLAGNAAGMVAASMMGRAPGPAGLARYGPAGLIEAGGNVVGNAAKTALAPLAARGLAGEVVAGGLRVATQAATEGALYGAAQEVSESILHDKPLTAEHLFAAGGLGALGGGALGFGIGGASSAFAGLASRARPSLTRALTGGLENLAGTAMRDGEKALASDGAKEVREAAGKETGSIAKAFGDVTDDAVRGAAADQAWRSTNAAKRFADRADKYLAKDGGTRAVGEVLLRRGVINAEEGIVNAALHGTPGEMVPRIGAELDSVGSQIGAITKASNATIPAHEVMSSIQKVEESYRGKAGFGHVADQVDAYKRELAGVLGLESLDQRVAVQDLLEQRKNLDQLIYAENKTLDPKGRVAALREARAGIEDTIMRSIDAAAEAEGRSGVGAELKGLKRDYQALSIAHDAAEDAASRSSRNRGVSPTDYATGIASAAAGHPFAAPVVALAHGIVRERGNAAAAVALSRMADAGTVANISKRIGEWTDKAARGIMTPSTSIAPSRALTQGDVVARAQTIVQNVRRSMANPEAFNDRVKQETQALAQWAPETSMEYARTSMRAMQALSAALPQTQRVDPLDPNSPPRLTREQAADIVRTTEYLDAPEKMFKDIEAGRLSRIAMQTMQAVMPKTFANLQHAALDEVARRKETGKPVDFAQRTRMTLLLGVPFDPLYRPESLAALQAANAPAPSPKTDPGPAPGNHKPLALPKSLQGSSLDRIEQR